jgi:hypothetical protein
MNAAQMEVFDVSAGSQFGLGALALQALVATYGFTKSTEEITRRLEYMADAEIRFVERVNKGQFNPANVSWRITARGINHLRERGL